MAGPSDPEAGIPDFLRSNPRVTRRPTSGGAFDTPFEEIQFGPLTEEETLRQRERDQREREQREQRERQRRNQGTGNDTPPNGPRLIRRERGSQSDDIGDLLSPTTTLSRLLEERECKLTLAPVPEPVEAYRNWRFGATADIVSASPDLVKATVWISLVEDSDTVLTTLVTPWADNMKRVDIRLFCCLLRALKADAHADIFKRIRSDAEMYNGRQALWILDHEMTLQGERLAVSASQEMSSLECKKVGELDGLLTTFELLRKRIPDFTYTRAMEVLRKLVRGSGDMDCSLVIQAARRQNPTMETIETCVHELRKVCTDHKFDALIDAKKDPTGKKSSAAGAFNNDGLGKGKDGKNRNGYRNRQDPSQSPGGKGPGKTVSFNGNCDHCGGFGHKKPQCWFKDIAKDKVADTIRAKNAAKKGGRRDQDGDGKGPSPKSAAAAPNAGPKTPAKKTGAAAFDADPLSQAFIQFLLRGASQVGIVVAGNCPKEEEEIRAKVLLGNLHQSSFKDLFAEQAEKFLGAVGKQATENDVLSRAIDAGSDAGESMSQEKESILKDAYRALASIIWLIDCGASDHIAGESLQSIDSTETGDPIATANGPRVPEAIGSANTPLGTMKGVRLMPGSPNCLSGSTA